MLKQSTRELCNYQGACQIGMRSQSCRRGRVAVWTSREVTIADIILDKMSELWPKGVGSGQLRDGVRAKSRMICHKLNVTAPEKEGTNKFEF